MIKVVFGSESRFKTFPFSYMDFTRTFVKVLMPFPSASINLASFFLLSRRVPNEYFQFSVYCGTIIIGKQTYETKGGGKRCYVAKSFRFNTIQLALYGKIKLKTKRMMHFGNRS